MPATVSFNGDLVEDLGDIDTTDDGGGDHRLEMEFEPEVRCAECGRFFYPGDEKEAAEVCEDAEDEAAHRLVPQPLTWANSVSVNLSPERDEITVAVSTGDIAGGFEMKLWRGSDGRVFMRVPHPSDDQPHEALRELYPGAYVLERTEPEMES